MNRRGFLSTCLAAAAAPYVVTKAGVLMPVKSLWTPPAFDPGSLYLMTIPVPEVGLNCDKMGWFTGRQVQKALSAGYRLVGGSVSAQNDMQTVAIRQILERHS